MRVLDLSRLLPGPFATLCLQGLGAQVLKVEEPGAGDYLRHLPPVVHRDELDVSAWFWALNRGKRSITANLRTEVDRNRVLTLCSDCDVLVESFRPGVMARLGLDPRMLAERFPRLIVASLTGWGQTGPLASIPGHDIGFLSLSGILGEGIPVVQRMQWGDVAGGGLQAALRIVAALYQRGEAERSGKTLSIESRWLDIAMLDGLIGMQQAQFAQLAAGAAPDSTLTGGAPIYQFYACSDGKYVSVGALEPHFLEVLLREANGDVSSESLTRLFGSAPRDEWMSRLAGACVVPVLHPEEVPVHPQVIARGLFDADGLANAPTGPVSGRVPALGEANGDASEGWPKNWQ